MKNRSLFSLGFAMAAAAVVVMTAPELQAYPDAKVETQTRPDFGLLLRPPLKRRKPHRPRRYREGDRGYPGHGYDRPGGYRPWDGPLRPVAFVNCGDARSPNDINYALQSLEPGGTLILRAGGAPCLDHVRITKPVIIQADGGRPWRGRRLGDYRGEWRSYPVTLRSNGGVCIDIATQGEVVLRNMVIESTSGGNDPCIYSEGADLRLESTVIRYKGDGSAVYVDGGSFETGDDTLIDAETSDRAIYTERARVLLEDMTLTGTPSIGLDITPNGNGDSIVRGVEFWSRPNAPVFGTPSVGIVVSADRTGGHLSIEDAKICGFSVGLWMSGANKVTMDHSHICRADKGIGAYGGQLTVENTAIGARVLGIQVGAAYPVTLNDVTFYGAQEYDVFREPGSQPIQGNNADGYNQYYSHPNRYCSFVEVDQNHGDYRDYSRGRRRTGSRSYMPGWRNNGGECQDPTRLDPRYTEYEERVGYDGDFYNSMQQWPQDAYHNEHPEWTPDGKPSGAPPPGK